MYYYRARYYDPVAGRFISEDPIGLQGGLNLYAYAENSPVDSADPFGLFSFTDGIKQDFPETIAELDEACKTIDPKTGKPRPPSAGACTKRYGAEVSCSCECTGSVWQAKANLRIYGQMFIFGGPWSALLPRKPKDRTVRDKDSAIAHEYRVHINVGRRAVRRLVNALEARTFGSKGECEAECEKTSRAVNDLFVSTVAKTAGY